MAVITTTEYYPDVGQLWVRMVELWEAYQESSQTGWVVYFAAVSSTRAATVRYLLAGDEYLIQLLDVSLSNTGKRRVDDIVSAPGFQTACKTMLPSYPSHTPATEWAGQLFFARVKIIENWTNAVQLFENQQTWTMLPMSANAFVRSSGWRDRNVVLVDFSTLVTWTPVADAEIAEGQNLAYPGRAPSVPVIGGGGGGSVDLGPVVTALEDIAHRETQTTLNNGQTTVLTYGGEIIEP